MKIETIKKLDEIAKASAVNLAAEVACGLTTPEMVREVKSRTKNPTRIEVVKAMIREDLKRAAKMGAAGTRTFIALSNAMKSAEQSNYLANAIDARVKRLAWKDPEFDKIYRNLFEVGPRRARKSGTRPIAAKA